jgi:3-phosphoshikimate 1-carboxyvinyltransferase
MKTLLIEKHTEIAPVEIALPGSKSESNRALIINALSGGKDQIRNLSEARDTTLMQSLVHAEEREINVRDAGTVMRFLTGYFALTGQKKYITGTERMCQRPIGILVEALRHLGADMAYKGVEGYPPLETRGFATQHTAMLTMRGDVSSQYISSVLMMAPALPLGLDLKLTGKLGSKPYVDLTIELMRHFGATVHRPNDRSIVVEPVRYKPAAYRVEADWSGASYWCAFVSVADKAEIFLPGLRENSAQGDIRILEFMRPLGVGARFERGGVQLYKTDAQSTAEYDFTDNPDLAQTVAVTCALKGVPCRMRGLESLRIKETDRIEALRSELAKIGASMQEEEPGLWLLMPPPHDRIPDTIRIRTYEDHRMAMAFAPLATLRNVVIEDPDVVRKSYPRFWEQMDKAGFTLR